MGKKVEELKLLYVEDNVDDVELLGLVLGKSDLNYHLKSVATWEGFMSVDLEVYDIVVTDYNIGGFTGLEVIKEVKKQRPLMPVIVLTGTVGDELAVDLVHAGATEFLLKPNVKKMPSLIGRVKHSIMLESERHRFQQEIVQKNLILDTILDSSQSAIFLKDREGKYLKVNKAACKNLELREDEIIGFTDNELLPANAAKRALEYDNYVVTNGESVSYEMAYTDIEGKDVVKEVSKTPLKDGDNVIGIVGEVRDVTIQVQLLEELKKSQGILSQAETITDSGSFEYNSELDLMTLSRNFKLMTGLKIEGSQISLRRMVMLMKKEDRMIFERGITESIESRHDYFGHHRLEIDGKVRGFKVFLRPDISSSNPHLFYGTVIDITADSENSQSQFTKQEEDRKEIARELHDNLGQKFSAISMYLSKIIEDQPENKQLAKVREIVHESIDDLGTMISSISVKQIEEHSLKYAITKLFDQLPHTLNVETKFDYAEDSLSSPIKAHVFRVVQEAVNNANKYSKANTIRLELVESNNMLDLMIEDDGIGFEIKDGGKGNGLKNIMHRIRRSNGLINIQSEKGRGTKILAKLPCN